MVNEWWPPENRNLHIVPISDEIAQASNLQRANERKQDNIQTASGTETASMEEH
jgi:hypothetical protein